jgi:Cu/Ag efflux protein CusF
MSHRARRPRRSPLNALAPLHPERRTIEPFRSKLAGDVKAVLAQGLKGIAELAMTTHAGMTTDEFKSIVREWLAIGLRRALRASALGLGLLTSAVGVSPAAESYSGTGVVLALLPPPSSLHATRPVIVIQHDPIPGLMNEAMSMPFLAASADLFQPLHPGDHVAFTLQVTPDALLVVGIRRVEVGR